MFETKLYYFQVPSPQNSRRNQIKIGKNNWNLETCKKSQKILWVFIFPNLSVPELEGLVSLSIQLVVCIGKLVEKFTLLKLFIIEEFFSNAEKTALAAVVEFNLRHSAVGSFRQIGLDIFQNFYFCHLIQFIYSEKATNLKESPNSI